jgi:hypothetical protein
MRKTRRSRGRNAEYYVINVPQVAKQLGEFHTREEIIAEQRDNYQSLLYNDFPELLQPVNSPHVSRQWDHPIETNGPMKVRHLNNILQPPERAVLNRQLKEAMEASLIRHMHSKLGSPILLCVKLMACYECALTTVALPNLRVKTLTHFRMWMTHSMSSKTRIFTHISTSRLASDKFEYVTRTSNKQRFRSRMA